MSEQGIKSKTKKLWIAVFPWSYNEASGVITDAYESRAELVYEMFKTRGDREYQAIEIEVEE